MIVPINISPPHYDKAGTKLLYSKTNKKSNAEEKIN